MDLLSKLAEKHRTDKGLWHHGYTPIYHRYFEGIRHNHIRLLEIGVGGYEYPDRGGDSLRMWREYFTSATIYGCDLYDKNPIDGVTLFKYDQEYPSPLTHMDLFDIIIDDGSHVNKHVIDTFNMLIHRVKSGGIYVIEDTETSYWDEHYGGGRHDMTTMNYFKRLCDVLNPESQIANTFNIESIHFYKGLIFVFKK